MCYHYVKCFINYCNPINSLHGEEALILYKRGKWDNYNQLSIVDIQISIFLIGLPIEKSFVKIIGANFRERAINSVAWTDCRAALDTLPQGLEAKGSTSRGVTKTYSPQQNEVFMAHRQRKQKTKFVS